MLFLYSSKAHLSNKTYNFPQVVELFPSSRGLEVTWSSVVKIGQSLYREAPGNDPFRPDQKTPVKNFFLSGSYTKQVLYIKNFDLVAAINRNQCLGKPSDNV
jgi:uncharacterized protein with NAD-binding domain and iron-sulfur cluster